MNLWKKKMTCAVLVGLFTVGSLHAATVDEILRGYEAEAKKENAGFKGFSADAGKKFFLAEQKNRKGDMMSCTTCHTKDPTKTGKTKAGKAIEPMAVVANKERFTDKAKIEKWFKRNCGDVYDRPCTTQEKGDFIAFMKSVK
jgi:cytochrome c553